MVEQSEAQPEKPSFMDSVANESHQAEPALEIKFYNYEPKDRSFAKFDPVYFKQVKSIESHYERKINKLLKEYLSFDKDTLSLVPKKENADLKNILQSKLEILNKKSERAMLEIMSSYFLSRFFPKGC